MKFIKELKSLQLINSKTELNVDSFINISSCISFEEDEKIITIRMAEYIPELIRGFTCDIEHRYTVINDEGDELERELVCLNHDLVLVYIHKYLYTAEIPQFEYIFHK
jgi:hypothetical protein